MLYLKEINDKDIEKEFLFVRDMPVDENGLTNKWNGVTRKDFENKALKEMIAFSKGENLSLIHIYGKREPAQDGQCMFSIQKHRKISLIGDFAVSTMRKFRTRHGSQQSARQQKKTSSVFGIAFLSDSDCSGKIQDQRN